MSQSLTDESVNLRTKLVDVEKEIADLKAETIHAEEGIEATHYQFFTNAIMTNNLK